MKKSIVIVLLLTCVVSPFSRAQVYYDAKSLRDSRDANGHFGLDHLPLFRKYCPGVNDLAIVDQIAGNPFLASYFDAASSASVGTFASSLSAAGAVGGVNVTNFADGLARFLVARFREELSITFFEKFKQAMQQEEYEDLRRLFPDTYKLLLAIGEDIYRFNAFLTAMRETFVKDLSNLYTNFKSVLHLEKYQRFFEKHVELRTIILNALYFIDQYANGTHPGDALASYEPDQVLYFRDADLQANLRNCVATLQLFSNSLKSYSSDHWWVPADSVRRLLQDQAGRDLYFGLIYLQASNKNIQFKTGNGPLRLDSILSHAKRIDVTVMQFREFAYRVMDNVQEINEYVSAIKQKEKSDIDFNDYYKLYMSAIDLLEHGISFIDLPLVDLGAATEALIKRQGARWIMVTRNAGELYVDVRTQNYSSAVINTVSILDAVFADSLNSDLRQHILRYGTFMANVATAKNSDEVKTAIESIALPAGSASIKKKTRFNIALNAYVGGFWGNEYLGDKIGTKWNSITGIAAPVGITVSKPLHWPFRDGSLSAFVSLIDVGAFASYRLNDDSTANLPEVTLQNIFAPGIGVAYGFPKMPVSLGYSFQLGPALREINPEAATQSDRMNKRWQFFIAVDIPLINFYTKSR